MIQENWEPKLLFKLMPWTNDDYPVSMKNLSPTVRKKAVEIANALLEDGMEEGKAIAIATSQAEEWAKYRDVPIKKKNLSD